MPLYDRSFYEVIRAGAVRSAETVVPFLVELLKPEVVVDVGCGEGWWLKVFADHGCDITGIDGDYVDRGALAIASDRFVPVDLATERVPPAHADLVVSLEVAEHLPPLRAPTFVEDLCGIADAVVFSAAIPAQGGNGHLNECWPRYWADLFNQQGYAVSGALRWQFWDTAIEPWYAQNLLLCVQEQQVDERGLTAWFEGPHAEPLSVIHPTFWAARCLR